MKSLDGEYPYVISYISIEKPNETAYGRINTRAGFLERLLGERGLLQANRSRVKCPATNPPSDHSTAEASYHRSGQANQGEKL